MCNGYRIAIRRGEVRDMKLEPVRHQRLDQSFIASLLGRLRVPEMMRG